MKIFGNFCSNCCESDSEREQAKWALGVVGFRPLTVQVDKGVEVLGRGGFGGVQDGPEPESESGESGSHSHVGEFGANAYGIAVESERQIVLRRIAQCRGIRIYARQPTRIVAGCRGVLVPASQ